MNYASLATVLKSAFGFLQMQKTESGPLVGGVAMAERELPPLVKTVELTGDGVASGQIYNPGFKADIVLIFNVGSPGFISTFYQAGAWRGKAALFANAAPHDYNGGIRIAENGDVTLTGTYNTLAAKFYMAFIADNGSGAVAFGSYAGNGVDGRKITLPSKKWLAVFIKRDNFYPCWYRTNKSGVALPATNDKDNNPLSPTQYIKSLDSDGFTVSDSAQINEAVIGVGTGGEAYDYIAFAECSVFDTITVNGNALSRILNTFKTPLFAISKSHAAGAKARATLNVMPANSDKAVDGNIQTGRSSVTAGMALGNSTDINAAGVKTSVFLMKANAVKADVPTPRAMKGLQIGASGGVIATTHNADFLNIKAGYSVELMLKFTDLAIAGNVLFALGQSQVAGQRLIGYTLADTYRDLYGQFGITGAVTKLNAFGLVFRGLNHVVFTFDGVSKHVLYLNGKKLKETEAVLTLVDPATPANTKLSFGCIRSTADARQNPDVGSVYSLCRLYTSVLNRDQVATRFQRAMYGNTDYADVEFLEEWDADNISGSTWYATNATINNATFGVNDVVVDI